MKKNNSILFVVMFLLGTSLLSAQESKDAFEILSKEDVGASFAYRLKSNPTSGTKFKFVNVKTKKITEFDISTKGLINKIDIYNLPVGLYNIELYNSKALVQSQKNIKVNYVLSK